MPKRVPLSGIVVRRKPEGSDKEQDFTPKIGEPFDFTAAEIREIEAIELEEGRTIFRKTIDETGAAGAVAAEQRAKAESSATAASKTAGSKTNPSSTGPVQSTGQTKTTSAADDI